MSRPGGAGRRRGRGCALARSPGRRAGGRRRAGTRCRRRRTSRARAAPGPRARGRRWGRGRARTRSARGHRGGAGAGRGRRRRTPPRPRGSWSADSRSRRDNPWLQCLPSDRNRRRLRRARLPITLPGSVGRRGSVGWRRVAELPPEAGRDPHGARGLSLPRQAATGDLRRQGQEPQGPAVVVLPGRRQPAPAHRDHGVDRRLRRVDGRQDRGRGAAAGVLLDQGVRPALQREVPRRQVLPLARGHGGRRVPAGDGGAGREAQGHPLLRALQPCLGDPRDRRHPAPRLPDAVVQQRCLQALAADRAAVPARLHRQVRGAVRRQRLRRRASRDRRRLLRVHGGPHQAVHQAHRAGDVRRERGGGLRAGGPAPRRPRCDAEGAREAGGGARRRCRRRRDRVGGGPAGGRRPGLLRAGRPGARPAGLGRRPHRRRRHVRAGGDVPAPALRRGARGRAEGDPGPGAAARHGDLRAAARRPEGVEGRDPGASTWRQEVAAGERRAQREGVARPAQDQAGQRPDHPQPGARRDRRRRSGSTRRRCGSSATTCRTSRAPRSWRRWWCSRTGWRARGSTAGSSSATRRAPTTSPRCTR